jgi:hypothetical protein
MDESRVMRRLWLRGVGAGLGFLLFGASLLAPKVEHWWTARSSSCTKMLTGFALSGASQNERYCEAWYVGLTVRLEKDLEPFDEWLAYEKAMGGTAEPLMEGAAWLVDRGEKYRLKVKRPAGTALFELEKQHFTIDQARQLLPRIPSWEAADAFLAEP